MTSKEATPESSAEVSNKGSKLGSSYMKLLAASTVSNLGDGIALIAYPWLASAMTRNAVLIALVVVVQRLPWLLFSLPAGVITDRSDRRRLMIVANSARAVLTTLVALLVLGRQGALPGPDEVMSAADAAGTDVFLYILVLVATLLLGIAEVLYDNTAQTIMPSIVDTDSLEKANGRLWSTEQVANTFVGPPLGAALLAVSLALPFFIDAATFFVSVAFLSLIPATVSPKPAVANRPPWKRELVDGVKWLWRHDLLRPLALILGLLNGLGMVSGAVLVLFAQEVLSTSPTEFAILGTGGAIGGIIGGWATPYISGRIGQGSSLMLTLVGGGVTSIVIGLSSFWPVVWLMFAIFVFLAVLWNVITVSLRQAIIPDELLGRVNSVYRFFAWGSMPLGALLGGLIVVVAELFGSREMALRMPWFVSGFGELALIVFAAPRLTSAKIEAARNEAEGAADSPEGA